MAQQKSIKKAHKAFLISALVDFGALAFFYFIWIRPSGTSVYALNGYYRFVFWGFAALGVVSMIVATILKLKIKPEGGAGD
jgi:hypothetical protein